MAFLTTVPLIDTLACGALIAAVLGIWLRPAWLWVVLLALTVVLGYASGILFGVAVLWPIFLGAALTLYRRSQLTRLRATAVPVIVVISFLLGIHALPGFVNPLLMSNVLLSPGAAPYSLYFNFDKTFVGILLLGTAAMWLPPPSISWSAALRRAGPLIVLNVIVAMLLALALQFVVFEPRWTSLFWVWAPVNLLLTCMSEEAFFRALIQRELRAAIVDRRWAPIIAVIASATLFGVAHIAGGWRYVLLSTVAGVGYALIYERTQRVEFSIAAHFVLNSTHFLLFTYPQLA